MTQISADGIGDEQGFSRAARDQGVHLRHLRHLRFLALAEATK
jgi:hypothetical protein